MGTEVGPAQARDYQATSPNLHALFLLSIST